MVKFAAAAAAVGIIGAAAGSGTTAAGSALGQRPSFKCQKDYELVGQVCVLTEYAEFQYECPKSAKKASTARSSGLPICVATESFSSRMVCPPDYYAVNSGSNKGGMCERVHQVPFRFECDDTKAEMMFHQGQAPFCLKRSDSDPHLDCPKDFKLDHKAGTCVKHEKIMPIKVECPRGARLISRSDKSICEFQETAEHRFNCPKGYSFTDESTARNAFAKGLPVCHRVEVQPPKPGCPRGYKLEGSKAGVEEGSSRCVRRSEKGPAVPYCEEGSLSRSGKKCEVVERRLAVAGCPRQQTLRNGRCAAKSESVCESGWALVQAGPGVAKAFCEKKSLGSAPKLRCPPNAIMEAGGGGVCVVEDYHSPHSVCPNGYERVGPPPFASKRHLHGANGGGNSGGSVVTINVSASKKGSTKRKLSELLLLADGRRAAAEIDLSDESATRSVESVKHRRKGKQQALAPPPGSKWSGSKKESSPMCIRKHIAGVEVTCPKSFTLDLNHNYQPGEKRCIATRRTQPVLSCPKGSLPRSRHCEQVTVVAPRQQCRKGSRLVSGVCVEHMEKPAVRRCPRKYSLDDHAETCVQIDRIKPDRVCPEGMPKGDKCEIQLPVEPVPSCPKSFVAAGPRCQRTHAEDAKPVCPSPHHKYEGGFCVIKQ